MEMTWRDWEQDGEGVSSETGTIQQGLGTDFIWLFVSTLNFDMDMEE